MKNLYFFDLGVIEARWIIVLILQVSRKKIPINHDILYCHLHIERLFLKIIILSPKSLINF